MLKTLSKLNTCVYYWNSVENTPNNYGKRFPPLLRVFPATPTVVNNSVGNGFYNAFPGNSSTQNELKIKKICFTCQFSYMYTVKEGILRVHPDLAGRVAEAQWII